MPSRPTSHGGVQLAEAVRNAYREGQTDYSLEPLVRVDTLGSPVGLIQDGDAIIFCCRRGEREIELTEAFADPDFQHFPRPELKHLHFVILTLYHEKFKDLPVAFAPSKIRDTLGEMISRANLRQLHCSESEKFSHVTFFFNGGNNQPFPGEMDVRIPSPMEVSFDRIPELSLPLVSDAILRRIQAGYEMIITNFANGDVIGHTTNRGAKIRCAEVVDFQLGRVIKEATNSGYVIAITADHGNLEEMIAPDGSPHVAHTSNPVPFILIDPLSQIPPHLTDGSLADIAPTLLRIMGIKPPAAMSGVNLVPSHSWGNKRRLLLIILDGWGNGKRDETNPIFLAETPVWDELLKKFPPSQLRAAGEAVGLQAGKPGNSEAGHLNIGAGRIVLQDDVRLNTAMQDGSFFTNEVLLGTIKEVVRRKTNLHLIGLLSEKSSHGTIDYPLALLKMAKARGLQEVYLHIIFDGRSTEPGSAPALLEKLEIRMADIGTGQIASGVGRGIALDRDGNYAKIQRAYEAFVLGKGQTYS